MNKKKKSKKIKQNLIYNFESHKLEIDLKAANKSGEVDLGIRRTLLDYLNHWWKGLNSFKRWGIYGLLLGILNSIIIVTAIAAEIRTYNHPILAKIMFNDIIGYPVDISSKIVGYFGCITSPCILDAIVVSLIFYYLIGALIGLIIGFITKK